MRVVYQKAPAAARATELFARCRLSAARPMLTPVMHSNYRGLAFLLSIGGLPLACSKDDTDTESGDSTSPPATNTANATTTGTDAIDPTPTSDPTDAATTTTGATDPGMTSVTTSQVTDTGDTGDTGDTETLPPATDPTCIGYAAHVVECDPLYVRYQEYIAQKCEYYKAYALKTDGQPCADAFDAHYVCLSTVECAELMDESACGAQKQAIDDACPSFTGDETGGGTDTGG